MRVRFLGTGTSHGIPVIGCTCPVCTSADPHNTRYRSSILVRTGEGTLVVDTTPEFRLQALAAGVVTLDAVLFTHAHADHIFGLDDVRIFNWRTKQSMPIYGTLDTLDELRTRFVYVFQEGQEGGGKPRLDLRPVAIDTPFDAIGLRVTPLRVQHGILPVTAYRFEPLAGGPGFAYVTDTNAVPVQTMAQLHDLDLLVLDALALHRHPTHFSLEEAVEVAQSLAPRRTLFTHISHSIDHATVSATLPPAMALAYDGLELSIGG